MDILTIITILYAFTGVVGVIAYLPTIRDLTKNIASANIHSYVLWTASTGVALLYALFVISDLLLELVVGLHFAACAIILILAIKVKYKK